MGRTPYMWSKCDLSHNLILCCLLSCYVRRLFQCPVCQEKVDPTKPQQVCVQLKAVLHNGCAVELSFLGRCVHLARSEGAG